MHRKIISTNFVVLRKTPYLESSLIISGISPEHGKIDFLIKGGRRISKKNSPEVDLFRVFNIEYAEKSSSIFSPVMMEYVRDFDRIAYYPDKLAELMTMTGFILRNTHYGISCSSVYLTLINYLERVIQKRAFSIMYIKFAYLHENGLLNDDLTLFIEDVLRSRKVIGQLLQDIRGEKVIDFDISKEYLSKVEQRVDSLCLANHIL